VSVEQPLPDKWLKDLEQDIPIQVEEDRLQALGFMKAEQNGSYERWIGAGINSTTMREPAKLWGMSF